MPRPASNSNPAVSPYRNPFRAAQVTAGRVDQGVDYSGSGPVYALGEGDVISVLNPGWPGGGFIVIRLASGPLAGRYVYTAENITPAVQPGQKVTADTIIGNMAGGIETGFAAPPPETGWSLARQESQGFPQGPQGPYDNTPTAYGSAYAQLLGALGAPQPAVPASVSGTLPSWAQGAILGAGGVAAGKIASGAAGVIGNITEVGHWLGVLVTDVTDIHLYISLGWLWLGLLLLLLGIYFWFRTSDTYAQMQAKTIQAVAAAA